MLSRVIRTAHLSPQILRTMQLHRATRRIHPIRATINQHSRVTLLRVSKTRRATQHRTAQHQATPHLRNRIPRRVPIRVRLATPHQGHRHRQVRIQRVRIQAAIQARQVLRIQPLLIQVRQLPPMPPKAQIPLMHRQETRMAPQQRATHSQTAMNLMKRGLRSGSALCVDSPYFASSIETKRYNSSQCLFSAAGGLLEDYLRHGIQSV